MRCLAASIAFLLWAAPFAVEPVDRVEPVPRAARKRFRLHETYAKTVDVDGFPIVASEAVNDFALLEAAYLIRRMTGHRPEILKAMAQAQVRFAVMAHDELTTDIPEHSDLTPVVYWDRRARGLGATSARPAVSCGEENLLGFPGDPYSTENILIHEFAHAMHQMGLDRADPTFDKRLREIYAKAIEEGLWKDAYAATNAEEYWAEGVQSWFDTNRENDNVHNHVDTREELVDYDPRLAALCEEVYGEGAWRYRHPRDRDEPGHLEGYDAASAPRFAWPPELEAAYQEYLAEQQKAERAKD